MMLNGSASMIVLSTTGCLIKRGFLVPRRPYLRIRRSQGESCWQGTSLFYM